MMLRSLFQASTGLNKTRFRVPQVADWASAVVVYVVVYPDGVPGPFNRDVNVKSPPSFPLRSARIRERYDRFYIQVSMRPQTHGVFADVVAWRKNAWCSLPARRGRKTQSRNYRGESARSSRYRFMGFHRLRNRIYRKILKAAVHLNSF